MSHLDALLKPTWGAEKWILEGWDALNADEQGVVTKRMDALFSKGLPFKLTQDRMLYIYAFSLLAQLEVLAIQVPLTFETYMPTPELRQRMRVQLMDEVFHGLVFTRILYELITPYAMPPAYNEEIEDLCNFIREEECPKVAVVLLNLVGEALIEEMFRAFYKAGIAPTVFSIILEDEHRHVSEAELYREIGLPSFKTLKLKLELLENKLITSLFFKYPYANAMVVLLGIEGLENCFTLLDEKHKKQLKKLNLSPGQPWQFWMDSKQFLLPQIKQYAQHNYPVEMSATRQLLMNQWKDPTDPTMVAEFDININRLDFFGKKYRPETLTMLMLQALSQAVSESSLYRTYLSHHRLYQSDKTYIALVVKLPDCGDHLGTIVFRECHKVSIDTLIDKVKQNLKMMVYCYRKRIDLEKKHPEFAILMDEEMHEIATGVYPYPMAGNPIVSLSNNGFAGYARAKSPLRVNEALKLTLLAVQRKPVWNDVSQAFEPQDSLPVSVSADHRIFNGDIPVPKYLTKAFNQVFDTMLSTTAVRKKSQATDARYLINMIDLLIKGQPKVAYKLLVSLQTVWPDFVDFGNWVSNFKRTKSKAALA